jgi:hypothetical protein
MYTSSVEIMGADKLIDWKEERRQREIFTTHRTNKVPNRLSKVLSFVCQNPRAVETQQTRCEQLLWNIALLLVKGMFAEVWGVASFSFFGVSY